MKGGSLWAVSVTTSLAAEEPVAALLETIFARPPTLYTDAETQLTEVTVYCERRTDWTAERRAALRAGLRDLHAAGLAVSPASIRAHRVARADWAQSWKRHFKPIEISSALLLKPSWSKRRPHKGQAVVVLDPGLSFGTGQHPTTAFCLEQLVICRKKGQGQSFLDIGTGSGILAIAAAKLGYAPVHAFDNDPAAVRVARANARRNRVHKQLRITRGDLTRLPLRSTRRYAVICANLLDDLLVSECARIVNRLCSDGRLVLAGILREQFARVQRCYERAGLRLIASRTGREWRSGAFVFNP